MKTKRTSLNDIAKALNVSKATVSFVLNDKGDQFNISKEKQRLIREKAKELLYVPNFFAKSLRQGETNTIGLVLPDISNAFIVNTNDDGEVEKILMNELIQRSIDGMIIAPSNTINDLIPILHSTHIPVVFADRPGDENADFVGVDNKKETGLLVDKFSVRPKKLAVLAPVKNSVITIVKRIEGTKLACDKAGIPFSQVSLTDNEDELVKVLKAEIDNGVDSFIALNNQCTLSALAAFRKLGLQLPTDVRLISFDDSLAFEYMDPPVSALRQPVNDIGMKSVARLYERIKETKDPGKHFMLDCTFIARATH